MRIAFNIDYFFNRNTGIGRYGVELMKAVIAHDQPCEVWMTRFMRKFDSISGEVDRRTVFYPWPRRITDYFWPGQRARKAGVNWVHSANCTLLPSSRRFLQSCMIHDMGPFLYGDMKPAGETSLWVKRIRNVVRTADCILVNSPSTGNDLLHFFPEVSRRVFVTPLGIDHFSPRKAPPAGGNHILSVGTLEPRKNIDGLLQGYSILRETLGGNTPKLVLAGMDGFRAEEYRKMVSSLGLSESVEFTGFIPDSRLQQLFSSALCLVHPAHHEGFGFTIPEAFHWNLPVAASITGGTGDFFRDCVWPVLPGDPGSIARGIRQALDRGTTREQLNAREAVTQKLTWKNCASLTMEALAEMHSVRK